MDYDKIIRAIKQKGFQLADFIPGACSLTVQGFRKSVSNKTLKIKDLETITQTLGLTMIYWWEDDDDINAKKRKQQDELEKLNKRIERQDLTIDHLNDQIEELKKRFEETKTRSAG